MLFTFRWFLFSLCPLALCQRRPFVLETPQYYTKPTQVVCNFNAEWIVNVSCKLKPVNWESTLANGAAEIIKPLRNVTLNGQVFRRETRYVPFLINVTRNICDIFAKAGVDFYGRFGLEVIKQFSNLKHPTCPLMGHVELKDAYFDGKYVKLRLPVGTYRTIFTATEGYPPQLVGVLTLTFIVAEKPRKFK